jgi:hypothetical protein
MLFANRASPEQAASIAQRDEFFRQLLLPGSSVFDPDWGSNAVTFWEPPVWLPEPRLLRPSRRGPRPSRLMSGSTALQEAIRNSRLIWR